MEIIRPLLISDITRFQNVNLDPFTETFAPHFYSSYIISWPECCFVAEAPDGTIAGYMIGKVEGEGEDWHGHCSAVTVAPEFRQSKLATRLMQKLEDISEKKHNAYFVDLFVRPSNTIAVQFYRKLGYVVFRIVKGYYGDEDAYDMRKPLPRDTKFTSLVNSVEDVPDRATFFSRNK